MSRRRYLKTQVRSKMFGLPNALSFIKKARFVALYKDVDARPSSWTIEIGVTAFKKLLEIKDRNEQSETIITELNSEISSLKKQISDLEHDLNVMRRQHNDFQAKVVREDGIIDVPKSPKSYINVAEERGTNLGRPGIQGGLAGLEKK